MSCSRKKKTTTPEASGSLAKCLFLFACYFIDYMDKLYASPNYNSFKLISVENIWLFEYLVLSFHLSLPLTVSLSLPFLHLSLSLTHTWLGNLGLILMGSSLPRACFTTYGRAGQFSVCLNFGRGRVQSFTSSSRVPSLQTMLHAFLSSF